MIKGKKTRGGLVNYKGQWWKFCQLTRFGPEHSVSITQVDVSIIEVFGFQGVGTGNSFSETVFSQLSIYQLFRFLCIFHHFFLYWLTGFEYFK